MMDENAVQSILSQIRELSSPERVLIADEVDRLTWRDRIETLLADIGSRPTESTSLSDEEIDRFVDEVRSETPLYERYWTRRRRSLP